MIDDRRMKIPKVVLDWMLIVMLMLLLLLLLLMPRGINVALFTLTPSEGSRFHFPDHSEDAKPAVIHGEEDAVVFPQANVSLDCAGSACHAPETRSVTYAVARKMLSEVPNSGPHGDASPSTNTVETLDGSHSVIRVAAIRVEAGASVILTSNVFLELNGPAESVIAGELVVAAAGYPDSADFSWYMFGGLYGAGNISVVDGGNLTIISGIFAGSYPECSDYYTEGQTKVSEKGRMQIGGKYGKQPRAVGIYLSRLITNYGEMTFKQFEGIYGNTTSAGAMVKDDVIHWGAFWGFSNGYCKVRNELGIAEWGAMNLLNYGLVEFIDGVQLKMHWCATLVNHERGVIQVTRASNAILYSRDRSGYDSGCDIEPNLWNRGVMKVNDSFWNAIDFDNTGTMMIESTTMWNKIRNRGEEATVFVMPGAYLMNLYNNARTVLQGGYVHYLENSGGLVDGMQQEGAGGSSVGSVYNNGRFVNSAGRLYVFYFTNIGDVELIGNSDFGCETMQNERSISIRGNASASFHHLYSDGEFVVHGQGSLTVANRTLNTGVMDVKTSSLTHAGVLENTGKMTLHASAEHRSHSNITNLGDLTLSSHGPFTSTGTVSNQANLTVRITQTGYFEDAIANTGNLSVLQGDVMCHGSFSSKGGKVHVASGTHLGLMARSVAYFPGYVGPYGDSDMSLGQGIGEAEGSDEAASVQARLDRQCMAGTDAPESKAHRGGVTLEDTTITGDGHVMITSPVKLEGIVTREGGSSHVMMDQLTATTGGGHLVVEDGTTMLLGVNSTLAGDGVLVVRGDVILGAHVSITIAKKSIIVCKTGKLTNDGHLVIGGGSSIQLCGGRYEGTGALVGEIEECDGFKFCEKSKH
ncbi:hypothetical protein CYMTET_50323 [Cymbomonas tetramitiformis]|uniref:Uncharacterized protein n=1 Tax=Cymbomonas tetramitiformis TaxID=36881 RepID=A0AAE0BNF3_9CHLO|nr:hypothetical protein CYMTET_50323 [Cymbomonas tetramitiformis]